MTSAFNFKKKELFAESQPEPAATLKPQEVQKKMPGLQQLASFTETGLSEQVVECLTKMGYTEPTLIQSETLKHSKDDADLLCLSQTGSGKTLSFLLPIVDWAVRQYGTAKIPFGIGLVIAPTRELCVQTHDYLLRFQQAGLSNLSSAVLYGGVDPMEQVLEIAKKPSFLVVTPGRILDHLQKTKGFHLKGLQFLVLDEADKLLNRDFEEQMTQILQFLPTKRRSFLFSATLTTRVDKLQRLCLRSPVRIEVNQKYQTVANLEQGYIFVPSQSKDCYLVYLLNQDRSVKTIVFAGTKLGSERLALVLRHLSFSVECLHGDMSQAQRFKSFNRFKEGDVKILVTTDVAARGIDISMVDLVVNYDLCDPKSYIHRVGRTARIGRQGRSITIVTQYDVEAFKKIQDKLGFQMKQYPTSAKDAEIFLARLDLCHQEVSREMKRKKKESFFDKMQ